MKPVKIFSFSPFPERTIVQKPWYSAAVNRRRVDERVVRRVLQWYACAVAQNRARTLLPLNIVLVAKKIRPSCLFFGWLLLVGLGDRKVWSFFLKLPVFRDRKRKLFRYNTVQRPSISTSRTGENELWYFLKFLLYFKVISGSWAGNTKWFCAYRFIGFNFKPF